jgi:inosine-uridine nucleoside N-ribohydrolase
LGAEVSVALEMGAGMTGMIRSVSIALFAIVAVTRGWAEAPSPSKQQTTVIIDTDFGLPPIDDGFAVGLVLNSPEARVLAITTVAGNQPLDTENTELLAFMERMGRLDVPLYSGAGLPLSLDTRLSSGGYYTEKLKSGSVIPRARPNGRARFSPESAASFIARTVLAEPHQITILAIGPLTNIAMAIRHDSRIASAVKKIVIMGGYFPADSGVVLHTSNVPNAEFNFWVDPIAARIVIESGASIEISPIDVSQSVPLTEEMRSRLASGRGPFSSLVREFMPKPDTNKGDVAGYTYFFDPLAATGVVAPQLSIKSRFYVDVDTNPGINYGSSVRRSVELGRFPSGQEAGLVEVQTKIDTQAFYQLIVERLGQ